MQRSFLAILFLLTLSGPALADSQEPMVTHSFVDADLKQVLEWLAKEMNRNIYIWPTVQGTVTVELANVPADEAMRTVLALQADAYAFKILDGPSTRTVVVAPPDKLLEIFNPLNCYRGTRGPVADSPRMEYLLDTAPSARVLDFLKAQYPDVEFTPHPTQNGFYARGSREDLLQIKRELVNLDRLPAPSPPTIREFLPVRHLDLANAQELIATLVPDASLAVDPERRLLIVESSPGLIDHVRELLLELDRPEEPAASSELSR